MRIFLAGATAVLATALTSTATAPPADATFPGRNGPIVYHLTGGKAEFTNSSIGAFDSRTRRRREIVRCTRSLGSYGCFVSKGSLSRDGKRIVFAYQRTYGMETVLSDSVVIAPIFRGTWESIPLAGAHDPVLSPDGSTLAIGSGSPHGDLRLVNADGRGFGELIRGASQPDWATNGTLAYVRDGNVWIGRPGRSERQLTYRGGASPSWAPDGRRVAFEREHRIWTVGVDGKRLRKLTRSGDGHGPVWSPDGRQIAFIRIDPATNQGLHVVVMRSSGAKPRRFQLADGWDGLTKLLWRPLPRR